MQAGGVGQGEGKEGTSIGFEPDSQGTGKAGDQPGQHIREVEISLQELAEILGEELKLPRIEPKGKSNILTQKDKYTVIRNTGPESLRHFKRTYKAALKRQISSQSYDFEFPIVVQSFSTLWMYPGRWGMNRKKSLELSLFGLIPG